MFWLFVGKHTALHKFGSQSILRLHLVGVCFGVFWQSQRESASNCGGVCRKSCNNCGGGGRFRGSRSARLGCVRVAPVSLSAFSCRCRIWSAVFRCEGSARLGSVCGCRSMVLVTVAVRPGCPCLACCPAWLGFVLRCCVSGCRLAVRLGCLSW